MRTTKRHRQPLEVMAEMNVTNLLDTAFILLITFMLVVPQLDLGLEISPPKVEKAPTMEQQPDRTLFIGIVVGDMEDDPDRVYLKRRASVKEKRVTIEEIHSIVLEEYERRPNLNVVIEPDARSRSEVLVQVIGAVTRAGVKDMGIHVLPKADR